MKISVKKICRIAMTAAMMVALKEVLSWLPNGELVTSIVCVGSIVFGWEMLLTTVVFSGLEIAIYGLGLWTIMYLYVWNILVIIVMLLKPIIKRNQIGWTIVMGLYGLSFGALCSIPYLFIGGLGQAVTWWIAGLSFDLMHFGWNLVFGFLSFQPLIRIMEMAKRNI